MRKYLLPTVVLLFSSFYANSQLEMGLGYGLGIPLKDMARHIQPAHQGILTLNYRLPIKNYPQFLVGIETGIGNYAEKTINQTFQFTDGTSTMTDVRYSSNIGFVNAVLRYDIPVKGNAVPYLHLIGGYNKFYTDVFVEDPDDPSGCEPLENENAFNDHTFTWGYGAGVQIKLNEKKRKPGAASYKLDLAVTNVYGGKLEYLNVKHLKEHNHNDPLSPDSKPFVSRFVNVSTQAIHEHQVAEIFESNLRLLQIRVGFVIQFGKKSCREQ